VQKITISVIIKKVKKTALLSESGIQGINAPQNKPLAGTGNPKKTEVCRLSTLNLANRIAEKTGIKRAKKGIFVPKERKTVDFERKEYTKNPGASPKLTTSANESNCAPNGEYALINRAINPSKKSKQAANRMKIKAP